MNPCQVMQLLILAGMLSFASGEEISYKCFENAVGISNPSVIPDNHITASSQRGVLYQPAYGRLDSTSGGGWCAKKPCRNDDWLQVDLGNIFEVCGVGSQGYRNGDEWLTGFKISYSLYGSRWERYKDGNNEEFEFLRSGRSINKQWLPVPLVARYIRFHPTKQHNWNCLSVEVYGTKTIPDKCINNPVGVSNPTTILDNQISASSQYDEDHQAAYGRLQDKRGDAWCAEEHDRNDDWLQVDLGKTIEVCAAATQGDMHDEHWVTTFKVSYSSNGHSWKTYTEYGKEVEFQRKGDAETVDHHGFPSPVFARFIRFHPTGQHGWNCLKVEVYGTESDGCVSLTDDDASIDDDVTIDTMKWFETPSFVTFASACAGEEALGMENGRITDQQITASSQESKMSGPANARLNLVTKKLADGVVRIGAWEPRIDDPSPYLQIDFGRNVEIKKIATQGREDHDYWVKKYKLSYAEENKPYKIYQEHSKEKEFDGNVDQNGVVTHNLLQPILARHVYIEPTRASGRPAMRVEFYGCVPSDRYQVVGRVVHMDFVREYLKNKNIPNVDFFEDNQKQSNNIELEVLADTVYVKGDIKMRGIKKLTVFSRKVVSAADSRLDLSAPILKQKVRSQTSGDDGYGGRFGVPGPKVEIYADVLKGDLSVLTSGGSGNKGQDGQNGKPGNDNTDQIDDRSADECEKSRPNARHTQCTPALYAGIEGNPGEPGTPGGYAGKSGNGGDAGYQNIYARQTEGKVELKSCRGSGAPPATNGEGGKGGEGSKGGKGMKCKVVANVYAAVNYREYLCWEDQATARAKSGSSGNKGTDGHTPEIHGSDGELELANIKKSYLSYKEKMKYPLVLLKLMKRHAEDLIWANKIEEGKTVLEFLVDVTEDRADASKINKVAKLRLGFLNNDGFDRFGKSKLFAPLQKWTAFKKDVEDIKTVAKHFQDAYNGIKQTLERTGGFKECG
ncbi:uncharacterized protein LOC144663858 [Oculina patagonica]